MKEIIIKDVFSHKPRLLLISRAGHRDNLLTHPHQSTAYLGIWDTLKNDKWSHLGDTILSGNHWYEV